MHRPPAASWNGRRRAARLQTVGSSPGRSAPLAGARAADRTVSSALPVAEQSGHAGAVTGMGVIRQRRPVALEPVIGSGASPA
jgi:hypothetical protein